MKKKTTPKPSYETTSWSECHCIFSSVSRTLGYKNGNANICVVFFFLSFLLFFFFCTSKCRFGGCEQTLELQFNRVLYSIYVVFAHIHLCSTQSPSLGDHPTSAPFTLIQCHLRYLTISYKKCTYIINNNNNSNDDETTTIDKCIYFLRTHGYKLHYLFCGILWMYILIW